MKNFGLTDRSERWYRFERARQGCVCSLWTWQEKAGSGSAGPVHKQPFGT